jgi:hypothetical protein
MLLTLSLPAVFQKLVFCLFGIYIWELTLYSGFEWSFITGRRSFRWPLVSDAPCHFP